MRTSIVLMAVLFSGSTAIAQNVSTSATVPSVRPEKVFETIVVTGEREGEHSAHEMVHTVNNTEEGLALLGGVTMIRRGNMAWEPTIRGMSAGQIAVTIDGMKMVGACVDRMDPVTAYVDLDNLLSIDVSKGASDLSLAQSIGGTLNLQTIRPAFGVPLSMRLKSGIESSSGLVKLQTSVSDSWGDVTARVAAVMRRAGNYTAGNSSEIMRSGFAKENYKLDLGIQPGEGHTVFVSAIIDRARDIGYPALIMDTRTANSYIVSAEHTWRGVSAILPVLTTRLYTTGIHHVMDDYDRSPEELRSRTVMPGMRMPMTGTSQTTGLLGTALFAGRSQWLKLTADVYGLDAFADMAMYSLDAGVPPMYLVNIGDARLRNIAVAAEYYTEPATALQWRTSIRADYSHRWLANETGRNELLGYFPDAPTTLNYLATGITSTLGMTVSTGATVSLNVARVQRLPTHIENYGFYLYSPMDNAIYMGNTELKPETSWQSDVSYNLTGERGAVKVSLFGTLITNYIAGVTFIEPDSGNALFPQAFRRYGHIGQAVITGVEANIVYRLTNQLDARSTVSWQRGRATDLGDDLPFMPPLTGNLSLVWTGSVAQAEVRSRFAAAQHSYSTSILNEDATASYATVDLRGSYSFGAWASIDVGVDNIFDTYYHEHASIGNLPALGRNVYVTLEVRY